MLQHLLVQFALKVSASAPGSSGMPNVYMTAPDGTSLLHPSLYLEDKGSGYFAVTLGDGWRTQVRAGMQVTASASTAV